MKSIKLHIKKTASVLMTAFSMVVFSSCSDNKLEVADTDYIISQYTNLSGSGELYTDNMGRLNFFDFFSMNTALLCPKPNCTHSDESSCSSYGMGNHPILFDNSIYFFKTETIRTDDGFSDITTVYRAATDGTNRKTVCTIENLSLPVYARMLISGNKAYFSAEHSEYDEYGSTTGFTTAYLCSFDLLSSEFKQLTELYHGYYGGSWLHGTYDRGLYISCGASDACFDEINLEKLSKIENNLMYYNFSDGTLEKSNLPNPIFVGNGYFIYSDDSSTYILNESGNIVTRCATTIADATIINGMMFSSSADICVDIKSGVTFSVNDYNGEIVAFNSGKYIIRQPSGIDYKSCTWDEIIGDELK